MSKLIPSAARLLSVDTGTKVAPVVSVLKVNYSTKKEETFEIKPYKLHKLDKGPATSAKLTSDDALKFYEQMALIRRLENAANTLYKEKIVRGFLHLCSGQEAVPVGFKAVLRDNDTITSAYRMHGWALIQGVTPVGMLCELSGRLSGCMRGKGGSMHFYTKQFYGGNGIVGAQCPLATGIALAHKYLGDGGVSFALYGDGAANQGQVFEAFNMATLWQLPVCFVCENNLYGMGTAAERSSACTDYYTRGDYVPGLWADGMDVLATREAARFAIDYCLSKQGPLLLEIETYRYFGHSMSDPGTSYRSRDEVSEVRKARDPIVSFKEKILSKGLATEDEIKAIDKKVKKITTDTLKAARTDPDPDPVPELCADMYQDIIPGTEIVRGVLPTKPYKCTHLGAIEAKKITGKK